MDYQAHLSEGTYSRNLSNSLLPDIPTTEFLLFSPTNFKIRNKNTDKIHILKLHEFDEFPYDTNSKLFLTDNNYQSFTNKTKTYIAVR